jgi:hypothetical protein
MFAVGASQDLTRLTGKLEVIPAEPIRGMASGWPNSPDRGPTDVRRVFIEVSYDGPQQDPANVDGALRDPARSAEIQRNE